MKVLVAVRCARCTVRQPRRRRRRHAARYALSPRRRQRHLPRRRHGYRCNSPVTGIVLLHRLYHLELRKRLLGVLNYDSITTARSTTLFITNTIFQLQQYAFIYGNFV